MSGNTFDAIVALGKLLGLFTIFLVLAAGLTLMVFGRDADDDEVDWG